MDLVRLNNDGLVESCNAIQKNWKKREWMFSNPEAFSIYEPPKENEKLTVYRHLYVYDTTSVIEEVTFKNWE